jgi:cation diffusion facilitator family transporter
MKTRLQRSVRATATGLAINGVLAVIKLVAGVLGHSAALVADAIESFADMASSIIVWRGVAIAAKPPDADHPYGHGRAETLATAAVAVMLLSAALLIAAGAVGEITHPHHAPAGFTLVVLLAVIVVKETLYRRVDRVGVEVENTAVRADAWHHRSDAITSAAAALGIGVALVGGKGYEAADDWAALFAAVIIAFNGWRLLRPATAELMDKAPADDVVETATATALKVPGVEAVEKCYGRKLGYGYVLDMHIEVDGAMTVTAAHKLAHDVEDAIRAQSQRVNEVTIHVEPHTRDTV